MAAVNKRLGKGTLTTGSTTLYTVPTDKYTVVKAVTLCNKGATTVTVTLAFAGTNVLYTHSIDSGDAVTIPFIDQIIHTTETITGLASANSAIDYYISGKEV